jgi:hypothetical protein
MAKLERPKVNYPALVVLAAWIILGIAAVIFVILRLVRA